MTHSGQVHGGFCGTPLRGKGSAHEEMMEASHGCHAGCPDLQSQPGPA